MKINSLKDINTDRIFKAFSRAFEDYDIQLNKEQLSDMLNRRGFVPKLSFAVFEGDEIVAFTLNGIGVFNGTKTAYDTGTGTVKEFRGRGLATKIFEHSISYLKKENIEQYLLEVLQHNTKAVSVYKKLGFEVSREFNYFVQVNENIHVGKGEVNIPCIIKQIQLNDIKLVNGFWDFYPSWQNSFDSINRVPEDFRLLGAYLQERLIGYCIFAPKSGDVTQIAVDKQHRRKGIASILLKEALKHNLYNSVKVINTDVTCNSITRFLNFHNIALKGKQFEMIKKL